MSTVEEQEFKNKTVFFAPIWTDNYKNFVSVIGKDARYIKLPKDEAPQYMLPYISGIYSNEALYTEFGLLPEFFPTLSLLQAENAAEKRASLEEIRLSCFSTGCVFAELHIVYEGLSLDEIADFSFRFKNAKHADREHKDGLTLLAALEGLIPRQAGASIFFAASDFKFECKMFHQICTKEALAAEELQRHLIHLRRGYHKDFPMPSFVGEYDMIFEPYPYDHWAGSQEGLVNIFHYTGNQSTDNFLKKYKPTHLSRNYRFMYLVLLNQRFGAICFLEKTSMAHKYTRREKEKLNLKTSYLKTSFSFSVVSDDQLYQTIYSHMYAILGIDRLLVDIHDNEEQIELLQNHEILENEKMTSRFLFAISTLSLFSVLVDAAGYFDRFALLQSISTALSAGCLMAILLFYFGWWLNYRRK